MLAPPPLLLMMMPMPIIMMMVMMTMPRRAGATCVSAYSYGSSDCANCSAGAALVSAALGCAPLPGPTAGPSDTAFFLSGSAVEGVAAWPTVAGPAGISYGQGVFGVASASLALASGSYLSAAGAGAPAYLPSGGSVAFSASAWVKCAAPATYAAVLEWGVPGDTQSGGTAPQEIALGVRSSTVTSGVRYVRITAISFSGDPVPGTLNFGEFMLYSSSGENIVLNRPATMSSIDAGNNPLGAVAGNDGDPSTFVNTGGGSPQWWQVDLETARTDLVSVSFYIRSDQWYGTSWAYRANSAPIAFLDANLAVVATYTLPGNVNSLSIPFTFSLSGLLPLQLAASLPACDSTWHHVALTYSPTASPVKLSAFLDGMILFNSTAAVTLPARSSSTLRIGWSGDLTSNGGSLFAGSLADMRIYNRTLSPLEVLALSQPPMSGFANAILSPSVPTLGATAYTWSCPPGFAGPIVTLARSSMDGSWASSGGAVNCVACSAGSYSYGGALACSSCPDSAALVSATSGCRPLSMRTTGPTDTTFYLSGSAAEGVAAFGTAMAALVTNMSGSFAPSNAAPGLRFGAALWLSGDGQTAVAGILSDNSPPPGAMYVFSASPSVGVWTQGPQLKGNSDDGDRFAAGFNAGQPQSIAISGDGLTAVGAASYWTAGQSGRGYVFRRASAASQQWATISVNVFSGQPFGIAAISGNGKFVLLGNLAASNWDGASVILADPGDGSTWPVQATFAPFPSLQRNCGASGALNFDGSIAATTCSYGGFAIYKRTGLLWTLSYSDPSASAGLHATSLNAAGTIAALGRGENAVGYVCVLAFSPVTATWALEAYFASADNDSTFGVEVHLNAVGDRLVVTRPIGYSTPPTSGLASVQIFQRLPGVLPGSFVWSLATSVSLPALPASAWFAFSAALSADGCRLLVGSPMVNSGSGAVWDFALYRQPLYFVPGPFGAAGGALALSSGNYLASPGAGVPAYMPSSGNVAWSVSAWVKCAAPTNYAAVLEWGAAGGASAGAAPQATALALFVTGRESPSYSVSTLAGGGSAGGTVQGFADGAGSSAKFYNPTGIAVDAWGTVYVADKENHLIRKIMPDGIVSTFSGGGSAGGSASGHADGAGVAATFNGPTGVALDSSGSLFVADQSNSLIRKITPSGVVVTFAGGGSAGGTASGHADGFGVSATFWIPTGIAVDAAGFVFVADANNNLIRKISPSGLVSTLAGGGSSGGTAQGNADGTGSSATFTYPLGVAVDASGSVFVVTYSSNLIRKISSSGVVSTLAGGGGAGGSASGHADGVGVSATFNHPLGISVDAFGSVLVADCDNNLIRKISSSGVVSTIAGGGSAGGVLAGRADGEGLMATFYIPTGVAVAASGTVFVADRSNNLVRKLTPRIALPACDTTWHHIALTYSPSNSPYTLSAFMDGALILAFSTIITLPARAASTLNVGWSGDPSSNGGSLFAGTLAELCLYNRTLSNSEVLALSQPPLAAYISAFPLTAIEPSLPMAGATAYCFYCAAGAVGTTATLVRSPADGSWSWLGGAAPACLACTAGSFASSGALACTVCPQGAYSAAANAPACAPCPQGTTTHSSNSSSAGACSVCAAGFYGAPSSPGASGAGCTACPIGVTSAATGGSTAAICTICAAGFFGAVTSGAGTAAATGCSACPMGTTTAPAAVGSGGGGNATTATTSASACSVCAVGFWGASAAAGCTPCPLGFSTAAPNSASASACSTCAAGYYFAAASLTLCVPCPPGTFTAVANAQPACMACPAGSFWAAAGATACAICPAGSYSLAGATTCALCPAGTFGAAAGLGSPACSGACASCAVGSTSPSALSCMAADARATPASLGLQLLPAAHPSNPQRVDLIVAPLAQCQRMASAAACAAAATVAGADGVTRYVVGTAAAFNMEAGESLTCA